jgi:hypothetical protein
MILANLIEQKSLKVNPVHPVKIFSSLRINTRRHPGPGIHNTAGT